jgi:ATP-dependent protease ClpP protease subunit
MHKDLELKRAHSKRVKRGLEDLIAKGVVTPPADMDSFVAAVVEADFRNPHSAEFLADLRLEVATERAVQGAAKRFGESEPHRLSLIDKCFAWASIAPLVNEAATWNGAPIVLSLRSPGGFVTARRKLHQALTTTPDGKRRALIVLANGECASAAAEFCALSDWCIAVPHASLTFHGASFPDGDGEAIAQEDAAEISETQYLNQLQNSDEDASLAIARNAILRLSEHLKQIQATDSAAAVVNFSRLFSPPIRRRIVSALASSTNATPADDAAKPADVPLEHWRFCLAFIRCLHGTDDVRLSAREGLLLGFVSEIVTVN